MLHSFGLGAPERVREKRGVSVPQKELMVHSAEQGTRIKVIQLQVLPLLSGVQRAMMAYFDALPPDRYEVVVVCHAPGPLTEALEARGIRTISLDVLDRPIRPVKDLAALWALYGLFRDEKPQVVHSHSSKPGVLGRLAAKAAGVPVIVHHNHGHAWGWKDPLIKRHVLAVLEKFLCHSCDMVIFVAEETRAFSVARGILPESKSVTLYNGVELTRLTPASSGDEKRALRRQYGLSEEAFLALFVGRLWEQKNPLALVPILKGARARAPAQDIRLVIAGDGPMEAEVRAAFAREGLLEQVTFLGWQSDTAPIYRLADCFVLPSLWEGLPLVLEESLAAGLPTLCSRIPGSREVITPEVGFYAPLEGLERLGEHIAQLAQDPEGTARMAKAARARAEALFDVRTTILGLPPIYERLLARRRQV